jgi:hypothetical protein
MKFCFFHADVLCAMNVYLCKLLVVGCDQEISLVLSYKTISKFSQKLNLEQGSM